MISTPPRSTQGGPTEPQRTIAFFGHDRRDSAIAKRVKAFERHGSRVVRFMFHRNRPGMPPLPDDGTIDLGETRDLDYAARLGKLARGLARVIAHRRELKTCDIIYARNLDMLALASAARRLTGCTAPIVYESLDIRRIFIGDRPINRAFRALERSLLAGTSALVTSSPDYMERYYQPVQHYRGPWRLLENKLAASPPKPAPLAPGARWIIGWYGVLKCRRSLEILARVASALGDRVEIHARGFLPEVDVPPQFVREVAHRHPNIIFGGPYANPADLPEIYGKVHMTWAADFLDADANSAWCLPNRLYEGGAMGSVLLASEGTATGKRIVRDGLGWALPEPLEETVPAFLAALPVEDFLAARQRVLQAPAGLFHDLDETASLLEFLDGLAGRHRQPSQEPQGLPAGQHDDESRATLASEAKS